MASKSSKAKTAGAAAPKLVRPCKGTPAFRHDMGFRIDVEQAAEALKPKGYTSKVIVQDLAILSKKDHELSVYSFGKILIKNVDEVQAERIAARVVPILRRLKGR